MSRLKSYFQTHLQTDYGLFLALLLTVFAIAPLLSYSGLPNTADGPAHLMRQVELNQAWQDGIFYPRWGPDLALGHGMPIFNYAPPFLYHFTQILHLFGLELDAAMKGTVICAMLLYSVGMYLFARDLFGPGGGLLAACAYLYAPYRLREAYIQGNYGQFWGLAFYPLILWAFYRLIKTNQRRYFPLAALSLAGLLLSHNISSLLFAPLFGSYILFLWGQTWLTSNKEKTSKLWSTIISTCLAIGLGLGLAAFFWLPAFSESDFIRLAGITQGFFDFRHNFLPFQELVALPQPLDLTAINPYYPLSLGLAQWIGVGLGFIGLLVIGLRQVAGYPNSGPQSSSPQIDHPNSYLPHALFFGIAFLSYTFMTVPASTYLWETLPLIALTEFPWRMLGPAIFCASLVTGSAWVVIEQIPGGKGPHRSISWLKLTIALLLVIGASLVYLVPSQFIPWGSPSPADAFTYEVESGAIGTTSTGEFLPRWADQYPTPDILGADYAAGRLPAKIDPTSLPANANATTLTHTAKETLIAVQSPNAFVATFRTLYWPKWTIYLIDPITDQIRRTYQDTDLTITHPQGLMQVNLPAGNYHVKLVQTNTPLRKTANFISIGSLVILLLLSVVYFKKAEEISQQPSTQLQFTEGGISARSALLIGLSLFSGLIIVRGGEDWFKVQSLPDTPYGVEEAYQQDFGGEIRLLGLDLPPQIVTVGDSLEVVAYWRALQPLKASYAVFLHLDTPAGETVAAVDEFNPDNIPTSSWIPTLYLRNSLKLTIPDHLDPMQYHLRLGLYNNQTNQPLPLENGATSLEIGQVWLDNPTTESDVGKPLATFGQTIQLHNLDYDEAEERISLVWQVKAPLTEDYTIFVHLLDENKAIIGQVDGLPYQNQYRTTTWRSGQIILDERSIAHIEGASETLRYLVIGFYNPHTKTRLVAQDAQGNPLTNNGLMLELP